MEVQQLIQNRIPINTVFDDRVRKSQRIAVGERFCLLE